MVISTVTPIVVPPAHSVVAFNGPGGGGAVTPGFSDDVILFATFEGTASASAVGHAPIHAATGVTLTVESGITYNSNGTGLLLPASSADTLVISVTGIPQRTGNAVREIMVTGSAPSTNYDSNDRGIIIINEKDSSQGHAGKVASYSAVNSCLWNGSGYTACKGAAAGYADPGQDMTSFVATMHESTGQRCVQTAANHPSYDGQGGAGPAGGGGYPVNATAGSFEIRMGLSPNLSTMNLFSLLVT